MNKTVNTILFMIIATLLNLLLIAGIFLILLFIFSYLMKEYNGPLVSAAYIFSIIVAIGGGFFLYDRILRWSHSKWNWEKYIYNGKKRRRK
jgi:hypothetical protein